MFRRRPQRHALAAQGPIVNRARSALKLIAQQFGEIAAVTDTHVDVLTSFGFTIRLSYDPGNYIFSRVYNLTISVALPSATALQQAKLTHRRKGSPRFVNTSGNETVKLRLLNKMIEPHVAKIDVHSAKIIAQKDRKAFTVVPFGGSYVWVLIPPVFKATTFPPGEPERIVNLLQSVREFRVPAPSSH